jgi:16S rRNA (uracil1498-N3)-methyltransferase
MPEVETRAPKVRLHVAGPLAAGAEVALGPAPGHYLRNVMRLGPGDAVAVFNGRDGEWLAEIATWERRAGGGRLAVRARLRAQTDEPGPALLFAPIRRGRLETLVEKATELGAAALVPVVTRRTVVGGRTIDRERLGRIAVEAAEQSGRLTVPPIAEPRRLADLLADRSAAGRRLYVCDETGGGRPIAAALAELGPGDLLVGPEGGFAPDELAELRGMAYVTPVDLGPRTLRAETAALAALSCWQAVLNPGPR